MKVIVFVKATADSEAGIMPPQELLIEMGRYNEELVKAGIMQAGEGLQPSSKGVRVHFSGKNRTVTDGPFAETKELVAGFWIWTVKSMAEAIEWVKRCPNPMPGDSDIEIRPIFELEDFAEILTPEIREQEARLARQLQEGIPAPARFETVGERSFAGFNQSYTRDTRRDIPKQWETYAPRLCDQPQQVGEDVFGVSWNAKSTGEFDYLVGIEVTSELLPSAEMTLARAPAGRYAVFIHREHVSKLPQFIDAIWTKWLPTSGLTPVHAPCIERYTPEFDPLSGRGGTEIWVAVAG